MADNFNDVLLSNIYKCSDGTLMCDTDSYITEDSIYKKQQNTGKTIIEISCGQCCRAFYTGGGYYQQFQSQLSSVFFAGNVNGVEIDLYGSDGQTLSNIRRIEGGSGANCSHLVIQDMPIRTVVWNGEISQTFSFVDCHQLTSVTISSLGDVVVDRAFFGCSSLTSTTQIKLPRDTQFSGQYIFQDCIGLVEADISETYYDDIYEIPYGMFCGCKNLTTVRCNELVYTISNYAFQGTKAFDGEILFHQNLRELTAIGEGAFEGCSAGWAGIDFPPYLNTIGNYAFRQSQIQAVDLTRSNCSDIGSYAFAECEKLIDVTFNYEIQSVGDGAFVCCSNLESINFQPVGGHTLAIGSDAFAFCTSITEIDFPIGVQSLGAGLLYGCTGLTSIALDNISADTCTIYNGSMYSDNNKIIQNCPQLRSITLPIGKIMDQSTSGNAFVDFQTCGDGDSLKEIIVSFQNYWYYINSDFGLDYEKHGQPKNWIFNKLVGDTPNQYVSFDYVDTTGGERRVAIDMNDQQHLYDKTIMRADVSRVSVDVDTAYPTTVKFGSVCQCIDNNAFQGYIGPLEVFTKTDKNFSTKIFIADEAFTNVSTLSIHLNGCCGMGMRVFEGSTIDRFDGYQLSDIQQSTFKNATLNNLDNDVFSTVYRIEHGAFEGCKGLPQVSAYMRNCIECWAHSFQGQELFTDMDFPMLEILDSEAFWSSPAIKSINAPRLKSIGQGAFADCANLDSIAMPKVKYIGQSAFYSCYQLKTDLFFGKTDENQSGGMSLFMARQIGNNAFLNCLCLRDVNCRFVENIGSQAFYRCSYLSSANMPIVNQIGDNAFDECTNLRDQWAPSATGLANNTYSNSNISDFCNYCDLQLQSPALGNSCTSAQMRAYYFEYGKDGGDQKFLDVTGLRSFDSNMTVMGRGNAISTIEQLQIAEQTGNYGIRDAWYYSNININPWMHLNISPEGKKWVADDFLYKKDPNIAKEFLNYTPILGLVGKKHLYDENPWNIKKINGSIYDKEDEKRLFPCDYIAVNGNISIFDDSNLSSIPLSGGVALRLFHEYTFDNDILAEIQQNGYRYPITLQIWPDDSEQFEKATIAFDAVDVVSGDTVYQMSLSCLLSGFEYIPHTYNFNCEDGSILKIDGNTVVFDCSILTGLGPAVPIEPHISCISSFYKFQRFIPFCSDYTQQTNIYGISAWNDRRQLKLDLVPASCKSVDYVKSEISSYNPEFYDKVAMMEKLTVRRYPIGGSGTVTGVEVVERHLLS